MAVTAKMVRVVAPGGVVVNFQGQTGTNRLAAISVENIKKLLMDKAIVEEFKEDGTVVRLTLENYNQDNGGIEVDESITIAPDLDKEAADKKEARMKAILEDIGAQYKAYFDSVAASIESAPNAVSVATIRPITITSGDDVTTSLPTSVIVTLDNGKTEEALIDWDTSSFKNTETGEQTITGDLIMDAKNTSSLVATIKVTVNPAV